MFRAFLFFKFWKSSKNNSHQKTLWSFSNWEGRSNSFLYVFNIPLLGNFGRVVLWCGERTWRNRGLKPLLWGAFESCGWTFSLAWGATLETSGSGKVQYSFVICNLFLSVYIQKNVLHITIFNAFSCFTFLSDPKLLQLHALGALLWDVKNEKS